MHAWTHTHTHTLTHACVHVCTHASAHTHMHPHTCLCFIVNEYYKVPLVPLFLLQCILLLSNKAQANLLSSLQRLDHLIMRSSVAHGGTITSRRLMEISSRWLQVVTTSWHLIANPAHIVSLTSNYREQKTDSKSQWNWKEPSLKWQTQPSVLTRKRTYWPVLEQVMIITSRYLLLELTTQGLNVGGPPKDLDISLVYNFWLTHNLCHR